MSGDLDLKSMPLRLYNTERRRKETLSPLQDKRVLMYTCGPTVYHYAHIGNFRTYVFEDLLRRTIKYFGFSIIQAMNLTDVDDKTIKGAIVKGVSLDEYTKPYKEAFFEDLKTLNIEPVEYYPAATDYIPQMIEMIRILLEKGTAYRGGDESIYFAIKRFPRYGCLSGLNLDELVVGASERVSADEYDKEHASDFVLWKKYDPARDGKIFWDSPFGPGRPGWHLECSAMATKLLGPTIDIHVGGIDNMFPHHENEIAQSEACTGRIFVKLWMHSEHLVVDGKKMSKSLGNFFTLRDLMSKGFSGRQIRYMLLQTHYKTQLNFTFQGLEAVKCTLNRFDDFIRRISEIRTENRPKILKTILESTEAGFAVALADDLNISAALAAIFDMIREVNVLCDADKVGREDAKDLTDLLKRIDSVLGVFSFEKTEEEVPQDLTEALELRRKARAEKNWALADQMRDLIHSRGYIAEDTREEFV